ncbi:hypothetical protein PR048_002004 [Dryococelus australis]|uniref:Uncharacterized protein n=1 Tax=Dryococelus australis TaxID=614101 RepID=A0ABQ9IIX6_9NEOP|nr:hypothetical protein PR048_002004 [Dryococelus australis]
MESFKPPSAMLLDGNQCENYQKFKQSFDIIVLAMGYDSELSAVKMAIWLNIIGEKAVELYSTFDLSEAERQDFDKVKEAIEDYCNPLKKTLCDYKGQTDSVVQDGIVLRIRDNCLQEHLLREQDLSLSKTVEQCRVAEFGKQHADVEQSMVVNPVRWCVDTWSAEFQCEGQVVDAVWKSQKPKHKQTTNVYCKCRCYCCGMEDCLPGFRKMCYKCKQLNHFAAFCTNQVEELTHYKLQKQPLELKVESQIERSGSRKLGWKARLLILALRKILYSSALRQVANTSQLNQYNITLEGFGGKIVRPIDIIKLMCSIKKAESGHE